MVQTIAAVLLSFLIHYSTAQYTVPTGFAACDVLIDTGLEKFLRFPSDNLYNESVSTYYAAENRQLRPYCILQPRSTEDVSCAVKALSKVGGAGNWEIAVRSGGHSDCDNNAAHRGVTIDLTYLNSTTFIAGGPVRWTNHSEFTDSIAQIQPGARWGPVYSLLEEHNVRVTGGRSAHVGVGGLLLSGGASFGIQQHGLSCENVVNYEVVLANGTVVEANATANSDLFKALKGGGNNLGIVTRFDMRTFTIPPAGAYGGTLYTSWDQLDKFIEQFIAYASSSSGKSDHQFFIYRADAPGRDKALMTVVASTDGREDSPSFAPFESIPWQKDTRARQPVSSIAQSLSDTGGMSYTSFSLTLQANSEIMHKAAEIFTAMTTALHESDVPVGVNFVFQPLPKADTTSPASILGHEESVFKDSILFESRASLRPTEVAEFEGVVRNAVAKAVEELRFFSAQMDGHSNYIYMNYAGTEQDVLASYGSKNVKFLRDVAARYDPKGFFQHRVSGGWKISKVVEVDGLF